MKKDNMLLLLAALGAVGAGIYYWMKKPTAYTCPTCGETFATQEELTNHIQAQHPTLAYTCPYCSATFSTQALLNAHILSQHPTEPIVYTCPYCGATFSSSSELGTHIVSAHPAPVYPYVCQYCGQAFTTVEELNAHITAAHPTAPPEQYVCQYCQQAFNTAAELAEHISTVHPPTPPPVEPPPTLSQIDQMREWVVSRLGKVYELTPEEAGCLKADAGWFSFSSGDGTGTLFTVNSVLMFGQLEEHNTFLLNSSFPQVIGNLIGGTFPSTYGSSATGHYATWRPLGDWTLDEKLVFSPAVYLLTWTGSEAEIYPNVYRKAPNTTRAEWYQRIKPYEWQTGQWSFITTEFQFSAAYGYGLRDMKAIIRNTSSKTVYNAIATLSWDGVVSFGGACLVNDQSIGTGTITEVQLSALAPGSSTTITWKTVMIVNLPSVTFLLKVEGSVLMPL